MATNHTTNYALNLWEPTDAFLREEFNENTQKIDAAVAGKGNCQVITGSYVGEGKHGESRPNRLVFPAKPLFVLVTGMGFFMAVRPAEKTNLVYSNAEITLHFTWSDRALQWYSNDYFDASYQADTEGKTYYYVALMTND